MLNFFTQTLEYVLLTGELLRHVQYAHTHEKSYKCGICDYACVERCRARDHMKMCHFGERERPYKVIIDFFKETLIFFVIIKLLLSVSSMYICRYKSVRFRTSFTCS